jgi:hypothetical protein
MLVKTTLAPGTIAPVESVTLPSIELLNCANAALVPSKNTINSHACLLNSCFMVPPEPASMDRSSFRPESFALKREDLFVLFSCGTCMLRGSVGLSRWYPASRDVVVVHKSG